MEPTATQRRQNLSNPDDMRQTNKRSSPLRQSRSPVDKDEEQRYEERRGEELRRQIKEREDQLAQITSSKDRLKMRIQNSLGFGVSPAQAPNFRKDPSSPLRNKLQVMPLQTSSQLKKIQIREPESTIKMPASFKIRHEASVGSELYQQPSTISRQTIDRGQSDYQQQLQHDNTQLQRRLNLVVAELDRVTREKLSNQQQLEIIEQEAKTMQRQIDNEQRNDLNVRDLQKQIYDQREANHAAEQRLQELDKIRSETVSQLNLKQDARELAVETTESLSKGLTQKLQAMKELEQDSLDKHSQMQYIVTQIKELEWSISQQNQSVPEVNALVDRLRKERDELSFKLENQNYSYDRAVTELARERSQIETKNSRHQKLMASKQVYKALNTVIKARKQFAMGEFYNYCKFDRNCHQALKQFAGVLNNCGSYQLRIALKRWFQNAMKPQQTIEQRYHLIQSQIRRRIKLRYFIKMRSMARTSCSGFGSKVVSINKIWALKEQYCKLSVDSAFKQWRDNAKQTKMVARALYRMLARQHSNRLRKYFQMFVNYSVTAEHAMREHCLALFYADEQTKLISYGQLSIRTSDRKTIRIIKLGHLFKAWKDSNAYRKFMMAANISAAHLSKQSTIRLVSQIFHALKLNKEVEKFELMKKSLNSDFQPQIQQLQQSISEKSGLALMAQKMRSLQAIANQNQSKIMSYFSHWRNVDKRAKYKIKNNFKTILIRQTYNKLQSSFDLWKLGRNQQVQSKEQETITVLQDEGKKLTSELQAVMKEVQTQKDRQSKYTRASFTRAVQMCIKRNLKQYLQRWHDKSQQMRLQEQAAKTIMQKWRYSIIRQAFKIYSKKVGLLRQEDRAEARLKHQIGVKQQKVVRKIFDAICRYTDHFQKAKRNLGVLSNNLDIWLKREAYKKWCEGTHWKTIQQIKNQQKQNVDSFDRLNVLLGKSVQHQELEQLMVKEFTKGLRNQGQKCLANTFARFYFVKAHRGMKKWKEFCQHQKHLGHVLNTIIYRLNKGRMYSVKAAFKNWIGQTIVRELNNKIKQSLIETEEARLKLVHDKSQHALQAKQYKQSIIDALHNTKLLDSKFKSTVLMITNKVQGNYYYSQIRHMFTQWAMFTKRQSKFVKSIATIFTKSMWQNGFSNIQAFSRDKQVTRLQNRAGVGMKRMYWKHKLRSAFNRMRHNRYVQTVNTIKAVDDQTHSSIAHQNSFVENTKRWTAVKGITHINRANLSNLFASWRNVTHWQKTQKDQSLKHQTWYLVQAQRFLQKLSYRAKLTIKFRSILLKFKAIKARLYKQSVFTQMKLRNKINRTFLRVLNQMANKYDTRLLEYSVDMMKGYRTAKGECHEQHKSVSAKELCSVLHQMYLMRMTYNLSQIKVEPYTRNDKPLERVLKRFMARNLRHYFSKLRRQAHKATVVEEVNEGGPIVEQALNEQVKLACYTKFLNDQGFTQLEIEKVQKWAKDRSKEHLARVVTRMQHFTKNNNSYLKPLCFDRWRAFCKYRKLMAFHLRNMNNRLQVGKSDLSIAFNRWKFSKQHVLDGIDIKNLISKCANDERRKQQLYELEDSAQQFTDQLTIQRDELVDNYIKSQRLACALARDNKERQKHKAFSMLLDNQHAKKSYNYEMVLSRNINMIQSLKDRIREFEQDNHSLAHENEELRQFSLDGYQIAKNVQSLSVEREHLSVDLADKAHTIQKLLDQNAALSRQLKMAQDSAVGLIQQSNSNMRRMRNY